MAVDTPTKRASALNVRTRCRRFLPVPDGTIDVSDRAHLAAVYYEAAANSTPILTHIFQLVGTSQRVFGVEGTSQRVFSVEGTSQRVFEIKGTQP